MSSSLSGNWTPVSRVTGGDTYHYTNKDSCFAWRKKVLLLYRVTFPQAIMDIHSAVYFISYISLDFPQIDLSMR